MNISTTTTTTTTKTYKTGLQVCVALSHIFFGGSPITAEQMQKIIIKILSPQSVIIIIL